jgi:hypothetical protein
VSLASSNVGQVHPVFGLLALAAGLVEIARRTTGLSDSLCNRA